MSNYRPRTIAELLDDQVRRHGSKPLLFFRDEVMSYEEVRDRSRARAGVLTERGVRASQRVCSVTGNNPDQVILFFALARLGAVFVPLNPSLTAPELGTLIAQARPALVVTDASARGVPGGTDVEVISQGALQGDPGTVPDPAVTPDDVAVMLPTSGTTGPPKLVMQTQRAYVMTAESFGWWIGIDEHDRLLTVLPLFHLNGLGYSLCGAVGVGASVVLCERFSASGFLNTARRYEATQFNALGGILEILMRRPAHDDDDDNPLRLCYAAPAPRDREMHEAIERRFGFTITAGYGQSESPFGTIWPRGSRPFGSMGVLRQHPALGEVNEGRVADFKDEDVPDGVTGELLVRNPTVTPGYFDREEETAALLRGGWLHTGDLVRRRGELFYFVGRRKQVIRHKGENVSPGEIEEVLLEHPAVDEVAVIGVPGELGDEDIKAFVVVNREVAPDALGDHMRAALASFKVPRYLEVVESLPQTETHRIAKNELPRARTDREHDLQA